MTLTNAEAAILGLVSEQPRHGYELEQVIEERGLRQWAEIGFSSIYFLLGKLQRKRLVEEVGPARGNARARKSFTVTATGRHALTRHALAKIAMPDPPRAAILIGLANWPALDHDEAISALFQRNKALEEEKSRIDAARAAQQPLPLFVEAIFDFALGQIAGEIAWIGRTVQRLGT